MAELDIRTERVDDVPLLIRQQQQMGIADILNDVIRSHGNRKGLSVGALAVTWLSFILSRGDHRMERVQPWAQGQLQTLSTLLEEPVTAADFADDRLADVLRLLSQDAVWDQVETSLGARLVRIYDLRGEAVRLDSTAAALYHEPDERTLFRKGHSKDHRPDLAQVKVMLASMDPLGLPLMTTVLPGNVADDGLYLPAVERVRGVVGRGGQLYIGDGKMSAVATRAALAQAGDFYLTPDAQTGRRPERLREWLEPVWAKQHRLEPIFASLSQEESEARAPTLLAVAYEALRQRQAMVEGTLVQWDERMLAVFSLVLARSERRGLTERLTRAEAEIAALTPPKTRGRRQITDRGELEAKARAVFKKHRVEGLLELAVGEQVDERQVGKYGTRPARVERRVELSASSVRNSEALAQQRRMLGWRLYLTNAPRERLSLVEAVVAYRGASRIERNFSRLKGRPLGLRPLWVQREDHARGMVRLLSLGLRVLAGVEFTARKALAASGDRIEGLYPGNPKRATSRPTTERLLEVFVGITLTVIVMGGQTIRHITPLSEVQQRILTLLELPSSVYGDLTTAAPSIPP